MEGITEYNVMPGVRVVLCSSAAASFPADGGYALIIEHCSSGRLERCSGGRSFLLSAGDMAVYRAVSDIEGIACDSYEGAAAIVSLHEAAGSVSEMLGSRIDPELLSEKYSDGVFVLRSSEKAGDIFHSFYSAPEEMRLGYLRLKTAELLMLLGSIDLEKFHDAYGERCTPAQIRVAREVSSYIGSHLSSRLTIAVLSEKLGISPTYLKSCFRCVYGTSVYSYVRGQKMLAASKLLCETDRTVLDIAGECGYDNGSKFSRAFSAVMGVTPSEYRRRNMK
ncbi:MAG: helix-turn-helix transcriptional regulator [Ruminococcus sp.]|nr:helix-turn-helix transcriptional regulator [Ruminococcus sp.]